MFRETPGVKGGARHRQVPHRGRPRLRSASHGHVIEPYDGSDGPFLSAEERVLGLASGVALEDAPRRPGGALARF